MIDYITSKLIKIGLLSLVIILASFFIFPIVSERGSFQKKVIEDLYKGWGGNQTLAGPILVIPFTKGEKDKTTTHYQVLRPTSLNATAALAPEVRYKGIYRSILFSANTEMEGEFNLAQLPARNYQLDKARICLGISDIKGIKDATVLFGADNINAEPGTHPSLPYRGIHCTVSLTHLKSTFPYKINLSLKGGGMFNLSPMGQTTTLSLEAPWTDPSFEGDFLPTKRKISTDSFTAQWSINHLAQGYTKTCTTDEFTRATPPYLHEKIRCKTPYP
ncbi:cell envelope integrity protein CreD [Alphaproteobacteria bacterium]|nr:cell envelope integrity protein CreD [Alphaproteobacteria bacterium]